jgi:sodium-dependent phosphate cotransporter
MFLVGIGLLGDSFKLLGKGVAEQLIAATSNPFAGLFIGLLATSIVQSSSVTTSMTVALVSGGALTLQNAVPIIMGANIGTTITCLLVSLGHVRRNEEFERAFAGANMHDCFNVLSVIVLMPLQLATGFLDKTAEFLSSIFYGAQSGEFPSPLAIAIKPAVHAIHGMMRDTLELTDLTTGIVSVTISALFIFMALTFMVKSMRVLAASKVEKQITRIFSANTYIIFLIGVMVTAIIQSSSITTSIMVPMIGAGLITLEQGFPIAVGANIGTTITALMAALAGNQAGLAVAFVHLLFNLCGTLIFFVPPWTRRIPVNIAKFLAKHFVRRKQLAFAYVAGLFFVLPIVLIYITEHW